MAEQHTVLGEKVYVYNRPNSSRSLSLKLIDALRVDRPFASGDGVSSVVTRSPTPPHRNPRQGGTSVASHRGHGGVTKWSSLEQQAGFVLRHRSNDISAYYAKADVALLKQIAQPWPEVNR